MIENVSAGERVRVVGRVCGREGVMSRSGTEITKGLLLSN